MESVLFSPKTKEEVKLLEKLAKQMRIKITILNDEDKEDAALLRAMLTGRTGKQVSKEEIIKALS